MIKRIVLTSIAIVVVVAVAFGFMAWHWLDRQESFKVPQFDSVTPQLPADLGDNAILVFSKTNSFRHHDAIAAVNALFGEIAAQQGLQIVVTENAAIHNPEQLRHFRLMVWNNNTGDVLLPQQQEALKQWLQGGGRWLGIHGAGGSREYGWAWYADELLRARFVGHTLLPHIPAATIVVEDRVHPAMLHLPARWTRTEEWYSFQSSPRARGVHVLASVDEATYNPGASLRMHGDHPLIWWHRIGAGYVFYSALGHEGSAYAEPGYKQLLSSAARWLLDVDSAVNAPP